MGKQYNYDTSSHIGGVHPEIQKNLKDIKKTSYNKELDAHRKKSKPTSKKK